MRADRSGLVPDPHPRLRPELGHDVHPIEAYLRRETGAYLDPWHDRLKTAYVDTLAALGVTADLTDADFLTAMEHHKSR
ncbi:hypothetical protein GCM10010343_14670 [Streptomyces avidinii]|uniref:Uncharacterized protein n=1 Tax=Streptomyces avidinii TaxID=1895 RepID=A0ABS4KY70_STRAV|nr:hypothetical protein [Streptomyces avidinii]GGY90255.1 hypothetical protein GCM10010343_14670 [Streptomyces avidinii]